MSTLCIGGVCVPYSAVIPLFFLCLRWLLQKAVDLGILPKEIQEKLAPASKTSKYEPVRGDETTRSSSADDTATTTTTTGTGKVTVIEDEDQFRDLLSKQSIVVVKMTADWCRPCKEIHPEYVRLAGKFGRAFFCTVDVDELEDVASEYNVAMMPTFLVLKEGKLHQSFSGIDLLEDKISKALA